MHEIYKRAANTAINQGIKYNWIVPPKKCSFCGKVKKLDGHHPDYNYPYSVIWLCRHCHRLHHSNFPFMGKEYLADPIDYETQAKPVYPPAFQDSEVKFFTKDNCHKELKNVIRDAKISQKEFSKNSGVVEQTVSRIIIGFHKPNSITLKKFNNYLRVINSDF